MAGTDNSSDTKPSLRLRARSAEPFLKWAGGKRRLIPRIQEYLPKSFKMYCEPFLGGGALYFHLQPGISFLADSNSELITTYRIVRDKPKELIQALSRHYYDKDYYYQIREVNPEQLTEVEVAARMIYLNRAGFNGLYRVNASGKFNVPFGRYTNPTIVDTERILSCSDALRGAVIENIPFQGLPWQAFTPGDFVYFDPPYVPLSKTSSFTAYDKNGFTQKEQEELADVFRYLDKRGVALMLSNAGHELVQKLYSGFKIVEIPMLRMINSKANKRGAVTEYLVMNY